jgi:hypothetical protein
MPVDYLKAQPLDFPRKVIFKPRPARHQYRFSFSYIHHNIITQPPLLSIKNITLRIKLEISLLDLLKQIWYLSEKRFNGVAEPDSILQENLNFFGNGLFSR